MQETAGTDVWHPSRLFFFSEQEVPSCVFTVASASGWLRRTDSEGSQEEIIPVVVHLSKERIANWNTPSPLYVIGETNSLL